MSVASDNLETSDTMVSFVNWNRQTGYFSSNAIQAGYSTYISARNIQSKKTNGKHYESINVSFNIMLSLRFAGPDFDCLHRTKLIL